MERQSSHLLAESSNVHKELQLATLNPGAKISHANSIDPTSCVKKLVIFLTRTPQSATLSLEKGLPEKLGS